MRVHDAQVGGCSGKSTASDNTTNTAVTTATPAAKHSQNMGPTTRALGDSRSRMTGTIGNGDNAMPMANGSASTNVGSTAGPQSLMAAMSPVTTGGSSPVTTSDSVTASRMSRSLARNASQTSRSGSATPS